MDNHPIAHRRILSHRAGSLAKPPPRPFIPNNAHLDHTIRSDSPLTHVTASLKIFGSTTNGFLARATKKFRANINPHTVLFEELLVAVSRIVIHLCSPSSTRSKFNHTSPPAIVLLLPSRAYYTSYSSNFPGSSLVCPTWAPLYESMFIQQRCLCV